MIRTTLYAVLFAFAILSVALIGGFLLVRTMVAMLDYFDKEEEAEEETHEEPSTTTAPTISPLPTQITLQELDERVRTLESVVNQIWDYILKTR